MNPLNSLDARSQLPELFHGLDTLLKDAVARSRETYDDAQLQEEFRGIYISEQEIDRLVERKQTGSSEAAAAFLENCAALPSLNSASTHWGLTPFDKAVMLIALAPEVELRYERIYAYLQDDVTRRKPTVDLALNLLCADAGARIAGRTRFTAEAPLVRWGLLRLIADSSQIEPPLLGQYLKLDESAVLMLLGDSGLAPWLAGFCSLQVEVTPPETVTDVLRRLPPYVATARRQRPVRLLFSGPAKRDKAAAARAVAAGLRASLLTADLAKHAAWKNDAQGVGLMLAREALRTAAVMHVEGLDGTDDLAAISQFLAGVLEYDGVIAVASDVAGVMAELHKWRFLTIAFAAPDYDARLEYWQKEIAAAGLYASPVAFSTLAGHFTHGPEQIADAVESARLMLEWRSTTHQRPSPEETEEELMRAAREQSGLELESLTSKVRPVYRWADLVLPQDSIQQLEEICQRVAHAHDVLESGGFGRKLSAGKGVSALFAGTGQASPGSTTLVGCFFLTSQTA